MPVFQPGDAGGKLVDGFVYPICNLHHPIVCDPQGRKLPYTTLRSAVYRLQNASEAMVMKMQYEVTGSGRPIVLVPGGLTGWASWEPFVKTFSDKRTVIRVQLLGVQFGLENRPLPEDYSVKTESGALAATLDSLGYNIPVDLVAWSFGAFTSLDYALYHPDRIRTLTLIEPPAMWVLRETGKWDDETQQTVDFFQTQEGILLKICSRDF